MRLRTLLCYAGASVGLLGPAAAQVFTGPYGPGGTWNTYQVITTLVTWDAADAAAKIKTAASTGLPALAGNTLTGHLVQISNEDENTFVAMIAAEAANSGSSAVWLGVNDVESEGTYVWSGTTGGSGTNGQQILGTDTEFTGWFTGEPNNSGTENAGELRLDGRWNDNKQNLSTTTRRYVVEWETASAAPVEGALQHPVYYTAPYGAGGKWNLYRVVGTGTESFDTAHNSAIDSKAGDTGIAGIPAAKAGLAGHLISLNSAGENDFLFRITAMNGAGTITTWLGATDDPLYGGTEAGTSKTTGWVWAGTSEPFSYQHFRTRYPHNAEEPNNGGTGENFVEQQSVTGGWNDIAVTTALRRYVIEWNIEADSAIPGVSLAQPLLPAALPALTNADTSSAWALKTWRGVASTASATAGGSIWNALGVVYGNSPGATTLEGTSPVVNFTDGVTGTDTAGRSLLGQFWPRLAYLGDVAGDDNQLVIVGKSKVVIPAAGTYIFNVHSDDGFVFRLSSAVPGSFQLIQVDGLGFSDPGDPGVFYYPANSDSTGARGVYTFSAPGTYQVEFLGYEGTGGSFFEVSWAAAPATWVPGTPVGDWGADWKLVGGSQGGTPVMPAGTLNVPAPAAGQWSVGSLAPAAAAYASIKAAGAAFQTGFPSTDTSPVLNFVDPDNAGNRGHFANDLAFPGYSSGVDDNLIASGGRYKLTITEPGVYTFGCRVDDFFALRFSAPATVRGRVWGLTAQGFIDANDPQTLYWDVSTSDVRGAVNFPAAGVYDLEWLHAEGTGGSSFELYYAKGAIFAEADSTDWKLVGDNTALTPVLPVEIAGAPAFGNRSWGVHSVHGVTGSLDSVVDAVTALQAATGTHTSNATVPVVNFAEKFKPGIGGLFAGDVPVPGASADSEEDSFAIHARAKIVVTTAGRHTFAVRSSDGFALRIKGAKWSTYAGNAGIDPADPSTLTFTPAAASNIAATASSDLASRGAIDLAVGTYEVDFITFDRAADFHAEVYTTPGNNAGTAEYVLSGTANEGGAILSLNDTWRLVGHQAVAGGLPVPGMRSPEGWTVAQSAPQAAAPPSWGTLPGAEAWLSPGGATNITTNTQVLQINYNDPGFGGPGSILNDRPNPTNTSNGTATVDDNYYATRMTGTLVVPATGTYALGFQSDDGQYLEFLGSGANVPVFTRLTANAFNGGAIETSTDGVVGARIQVNAGTGNSRLIGEVALAAGEYPIRAIWFEGTSGSYNEIFAAPSPPDGRPVSLLTSGGSALVADVPGLALAPSDVVPPAGDFEITGIVLNPANTVTITWSSEPGASYTVQTSTDLQPAWDSIAGSVPSAGTSTSYTSPVLNPATATRLFWRIKRNP